MAGHLSYHRFMDHFLVACAVVMRGKTNELINVARAAGYIKKRFDDSWPEAAMKQLAQDELLRGSYTAHQEPRYNLTGPGLTRAEQLAKNRGKKLYDLIRDYARRSTAEDETFAEQPDSPVLGAEEDTIQMMVNMGRMIPLSGDDRLLCEEVEEALEALRTNNSLIAAGHAEFPEHLARLGMARRLLQEEQAYQGALHFFLLDSLRWFYTRVKHDGLLALIQRLMDSTIELLKK
jgi:hypothetical protein